MACGGTSGGAGVSSASVIEGLSNSAGRRLSYLLLARAGLYREVPAVLHLPWIPACTMQAADLCQSIASAWVAWELIAWDWWLLAHVQHTCHRGQQIALALAVGSCTTFPICILVGDWRRSTCMTSTDKACRLCGCFWIHQAQVTQQANLMANKRSAPVWALAAILFLGWNEFMVVLWNPLYLILGAIVFMFGWQMYGELDVDAEMQRGPLMGLLNIWNKLGDVLRSVSVGCVWPVAAACGALGEYSAHENDVEVVHHHRFTCKGTMHSKAFMMVPARQASI